MVTALLLEVMVVALVFDSEVAVEVAMGAIFEIEVAVDVEMSALKLGKAVDTDGGVEYDRALTLLVSPSLVGFDVDDDGMEALQYLKADISLTLYLINHQVRYGYLVQCWTVLLDHLDAAVELHGHSIQHHPLSVVHEVV